MAATELIQARLSVRRYVGDHCAHQFRQSLLHQLLAHAEHHERACELLAEEISATVDLIAEFPGHEAIWAHRRALAAMWVQCKPLEFAAQ
eukprot:gene18649-22262_t